MLFLSQNKFQMQISFRNNCASDLILNREIYMRDLLKVQCHIILSTSYNFVIHYKAATLILTVCLILILCTLKTL